jgi:hypothetical protein
MADKVQSKCLCCGKSFTINMRSRVPQKYCRTRMCRGSAQGRAPAPIGGQTVIPANWKPRSSLCPASVTWVLGCLKSAVQAAPKHSARI